MNNICIIEDHDRALKIWKDNKVKSVDLVHVDAHVDFDFYKILPVKYIVECSRSLKELKRNLENNIAFNHYIDNLDEQVYVGNYIYPALRDGIVKDFYWVIPGGRDEFKASLNRIKALLERFSRKGSGRNVSYELRGEMIVSTLLGRKFTVCTLDYLPEFKQSVLLDIDVDFLFNKSYADTGGAMGIKMMKPWLSPENLVKTLKGRLKNIRVATIAYSVNEWYTPMRYKHFGDEIAYHLSPSRFARRFKRSLKAGAYFNEFILTGSPRCYRAAVKLNRSYRAKENNYGFYYLARRRFSAARGEFLRILKADPSNPACLLGLGRIFMERRDFVLAGEYFSKAIALLHSSLFRGLKRYAFFASGVTQFKLKNFNESKKLLSRCGGIDALAGQGRYFLGRILEKEKRFPEAALFYREAVKFGFDEIEALSRLCAIAGYCRNVSSIVEYIAVKYRRSREALRVAADSDFLRDGRFLLKKLKLSSIKKKLDRFSIVTTHI